MQRFILRQNILRFRRMLAEEDSPLLRETALRLLKEAEHELALIEWVWTWTYPDLGKEHGEALDELLGAAMTRHGADFGTLQIWEEGTAMLHLIAQRSLHGSFIERFAHVDSGSGTVCDHALRKREQILVRDVEQDPAFASILEETRSEGIRALQSTPLISLDGAPVGILSTYFRMPRPSGAPELPPIDDLAARAAVILTEHLTEAAAAGAEDGGAIHTEWSA
ncbi:GAF domain-containing protein [Mangrovicella endophytica]|uniref:GAF domain-containing protein n=1 Tax=Mangrovicella endophytica TaxID=2066697 RepID=UPI000C9EBCC0|nr:GAF domain-containing protein [Mangrovicella endophytica]